MHIATTVTAKRQKYEILKLNLKTADGCHHENRYKLAGSRKNAIISVKCSPTDCDIFTLK